MKHVKYPRTFHLPWSEGITSDDKVMSSKDLLLVGHEVVVTEKFDGENTTIYPDKIHARSIDTKYHPSRTWVNNFAKTFQYRMGHDLRVCGENLFAKHSIGYTDLDSYFLGFSAWYDDICIDWDNTMHIFDDLGIAPVRVLYRGKFDSVAIAELWDSEKKDDMEGYVVRPTGRFTRDQFSSFVGKFVRANHVQTDTHWMSKEVVPNGMKK